MGMWVRLGLLLALAGLVPVGSAEVSASPGTTTRASVGTAGAQGTGDSLSPAVNEDGRYVAFVSWAPNLVTGDTDACELEQPPPEPPITYNCPDIFVRDRELVGLTQRVNVSSGGVEANGESWNPSISADGRYVAFQSLASNLVSGDTNNYCQIDPDPELENCEDVFVRDRQAGTTTRVSVATAGTEGNAGSGGWLAISSDGRFVAFTSDASNLVTGDTSGFGDVFVRDRQASTTERVSLNSAEEGANGESYYAAISADGRYVAFGSAATNLVTSDTNGFPDVFVRDRQAGTTTRVSVSSGGTQGNGESFYAAISSDGRFVAFGSFASNLVSGDSNGYLDIFVRDRQAGTTERVSLDSVGIQGNAGSFDPAISADGHDVAFESYATNLVAGDTNAVEDVFVRDRWAGTTERVSTNSGGVQGNGASTVAAISGNGRFAAFESLAANLVLGDTNAASDIFVYERVASPVGGIARLPDVSGSSAPNYVPLAGLGAAALALVAAGAWYAVKRVVLTRQG